MDQCRLAGSYCACLHLQRPPPPPPRTLSHAATTSSFSTSSFSAITYTGVDLGGSRGARPPIIELGAKVSFCPPIIQVRILENIETISETKTRNLTTTRYHNENKSAYFNYLHPIIFKIFKPRLSAKLTCRAY